VKESQKDLFLNWITANGRIMTSDEAFDFYVSHVMRNDATCKWNPYKRQGTGGHDDYSLSELEAKARTWHKMALGGLLLGHRLRVLL
jgi:hypothetical protein